MICNICEILSILKLEDANEITKFKNIIIKLNNPIILSYLISYHLEWIKESELANIIIENHDEFTCFSILANSGENLDELTREKLLRKIFMSNNPTVINETMNLKIDKKFNIAKRKYLHTK